MASPKHSGGLVLSSSVANLDWDSPSAKTGTVKRRPNSCGDRLSCHQVMKEDLTDGQKMKDRKASLDANGLEMRNDQREEVRSLNLDHLEGEYLNFNDEVYQCQNEDGLENLDEVLQIEILGNEFNILESKIEYTNVLIKPTSLLCSESLEKNHKFLIDKTGKVHPETATLFSPDASLADSIIITSQKPLNLKEPSGLRKNSYDGNTLKNSEQKKNSKILIRAEQSDLKDGPQSALAKLAAKESKLKMPKLKLSFSPSKTNDKLKFKMFSTKTSDSKPSNLMSLFKDPPKQTENEYVKLKFNSNNQRLKYGVISKMPSKIPKTPIDSENKTLHMSPNKKYTVTSQHGVRFDKENYVIYDPESGFDVRREIKMVKEVEKGSQEEGSEIKTETRLTKEEGRTSVEDRGRVNQFLESISDTDSGIISPMSPFDYGSDADRKNLRISPQYGRLRIPGSYGRSSDYENVFSVLVDPVEEEPVVTVAEERGIEQDKIYTDWANHYLERGRSARRVRALAECRDGDLLRDLLESVTGQRVPAVRQYDAVSSCLHFLHTQRVQGLEQVTAEDIREGKLKAILALFFALSRHKQATKQQLQQKNQQSYNNHLTANLAGSNGAVGKTGDLSSITRMTGGAACEDLIAATNANMVQHRQANKAAAAAAAGTAIPLPRRARPLPPTPGSNGNGTSKGGGSAVSASSSRSSSPGGNSRPNNLHGILHQNNTHGSRPNSSLLAPGSKIPSSPYSTQPASPGAPTPPPHQNHNVPTKHSMLDKLKLFKDKSSSDRHKNNSVISKRTSSSSGFSSAKSERSDSSLSLNESHNPSHTKGQNTGSKQLQQTEVSLKENQKTSSKNVKSKLAPSKTQKDTLSKPQKSDKSSKNSPKLQVKEKESKLTAPKQNQNSKIVLIEDNVKSSKLSMKLQDTKISRLSGSQMKLCGDQKHPTDSHKVQTNEAKTVTSIQQPKACPTANGLPSSNSSASFVASNPNMAAQVPNNTGIPKPTAAVKGTSKIPKDEKPAAGIAKATGNATAQMSPSQSVSTLMTNSANSTTPMPFNRELSSLTKENCQKQTLVVSPMPNSYSDNNPVSAVAMNPAISSQMSESSNSNSTHSASTGPHSNSSDGSVIYRPSSESGSEMSKIRHNPIIPNRKVDPTFINEMIPENMMEKNEPKKKLFSDEDERIEVQVHRDRKAKEAVDKNIDRTRVCDSPSHGRDNSLGDEDNPSMNVLPMRPLLRGYNSHLTLPARSSGQMPQKNGVPQGFPHHANTVKANFGRESANMNFRNGQYGGYASSEYCDVDIAAGYMSEGDCLRRLGNAEVERERERVRARAGDMMDGYLSEGGASLYARRMHAFQPGPGMPQFDERARLSSQRNVSSQGVAGGPMEPQYRPAPQRAKKAEAGQQTDATNYKILNASNGHGVKNGDSQWKKYTDSPGVGSPVQAGGPPSPLSGRRRTSGNSSSSSGGGQSRSKQQQSQQPERMSAAQQLQTTAPPPHQMHFAQMNAERQHSSSKMGPGGQLQSPGSVSSQSSNRSGGNHGNHPHGNPPMMSPLPPAAGVASGNGGPNGGSNGRVKGVPQSFGYVKRQGGQAQQAVQNGGQGGGRTAQVSAVPRTKVKVSGGTQTCTQDLQIHKGGAGVKSFSLSGSAASQLSQSVRERLMMGSQSLPKPGSHDFAVLFQHHRVPPRGGMKISDGSLSDTQTYSDVKSDYGSPYTSWLRHSNTYSATGRLSECDSMESLQSLQPGGTRAPPRLLHQPAPARLNRSNSIRSTKSEKLYPSMLQRSSEGEYEPYYCLPVHYGDGQGLPYGASEPPSPSPRSALSPPGGHPGAHSLGLLPPHQLVLPSQHHSARHSHYKKNDDAHGSTASLVSTASSLHSSAEERQAHEARKLRRELTDAKEKVHTLTTQLTTNAHVVSAFEQSLSNMTQRLQSLTATAERKDSELTQLRQTIELLRKQSIQAGLTSAHMTSMGIKQDSVSGPNQEMPKQPSTTGSIGSGTGSNMTRHLSTDSVNSLNSLSSGCSSAQDKKHKKKGWLRSSFTKAFSRNAKISKTSKHSSLSHLSPSADGGGGHHSEHQHGVIREGSNENSLENSHELLADTILGEKKEDKDGLLNGSNTSDPDAQLVDELKKQLREKDLVLTDIRLEALSSAHQLESLKDTVIKMRNEMLNLKQNNERLQRLVRPKSLAGSHASLAPGAGGPPSPPAASSHDDARRFSAADAQRPDNGMDHGLDFITSTPPLEYDAASPSPSLYLRVGEGSGGDGGLLMATARLGGADCQASGLPAPKCRELAMGETYADLGLNENSADLSDGKKIAIAVYLGQPDTFPRYYEEVCESLNNCDSRFYSNRSSAAFNNCQAPDFSLQESALSRLSLQNPVMSPDKENGHDFQNIQNLSNTNSLKSNKSSHSNYANKNTFENGTNSTAINCNEFVIAYTYISGKTTWQNLDHTVRKTFKDYLSRIDPGTNLGLNTDSITSYHLGEATRGPEVGFPELLPCGYIIGMVKTLYICLQGVGSLAFDSLIPKNIVYRYVSLLSEHRRVILCGPSGTGKSYLAARLAEFHVARTAAHLNPAEAIATFNVEHKSSKELRQYLSNVAEQCGGEALLPSVLILDNLHHASALSDVFSGLLGARRTNLPCIIGTMSQATCTTTNLQLHHNFRWLLTANHMEPVKGFLARYLRRKQLVAELGGSPRCPRLSSVLEWLPAVWQHVNSFLEAHSSSDVTVGPRLFLGCPLDLAASQSWFTSVWNYSVVPYLVEAAREGVALYGRRGAWADPAKYVRDSYPWPDPEAAQNLRGITLEDIGLDGNSTDTSATNNQDPLLNMLMRLQEAANYSGNHSQDSDNASLDSNLTHDSSAGNDL